jgi:hypothetical protein
MKSGNLNFLEPCGPLQACNGTAFYREMTSIDRMPEVTDTNANAAQQRSEHVERIKVEDDMTVFV